jgi:dienelactone hydrolase
MPRRLAVLATLLIGLAAATARAGDLDVPPDKIPGGKPETMMRQYWLGQVAQAFESWQKEYETVKTPEEIALRQRRLREKFLEALGGLPPRTPLYPQITGKVDRDGYRVEKIIFQSQPQHFVTALLFLPDATRFPPPCPGVLIPCGHSANGKAHDAYQSMGASLALAGMAALVFDPIDQGERGQFLDDGKPRLVSTAGHSMVGIGCTLLGRNTARFEIWDGMRAIDYLQSRPEVDPHRIGCTGNSGGGTQTSYLMALDERLSAAAPSCYLCGFSALLSTIGPQDAEQNIFGQLAFGMDQADYLMMQAPMPILVCAATKDFFDIHGTWDIFRSAKRLYTRMGFAERLALLENDAGHNYNEVQRTGVLRWMNRWLRHDDQPLTEPPLVLLSDAEAQCTPGGQVMLLPDARSTYDLNLDYERQLQPHRVEMCSAGNCGELLARVGRIAGIRKLGDLPPPEVEKFGVVERPDYHIERLLLKIEEGVYLPALQFLPEKPAARVLLYLHEQGKAADADGAIERLVREGATVLAVDLPGTGQTQPASSDTRDVFMAYLLGRSYVGFRAEDILICGRYAQEHAGAAEGVDLVVVGQVGIPALHAAVLEPGLFRSVKLVRTLQSWSSVIQSKLTQVRPDQVVFGALASYDLPDLAAALGAKLTVEQPVESVPPPRPQPRKPQQPKKNALRPG